MEKFSWGLVCVHCGVSYKEFENSPTKCGLALDGKHRFKRGGE